MKNSLFGYLPEMIKIRACDRPSYYAVSSEQTGFSVSVDTQAEQVTPRQVFPSSQLQWYMTNE